MMMAIVIVRVKWVCNFMVCSYCDVGDGDGDYDDKEEPTDTSYSGFFFLSYSAAASVRSMAPLPFLSVLYRRFQIVEFLQGDDVSVTPDPQPGGPWYLFVRHLAHILFVVGGPTSRYVYIYIIYLFIYLLQLGFYPVAVVILHVNKT